MSMAASEYLSTKSGRDIEDSRRAALYTGVAYIFTVTALVLPYLLLSNYYACLAVSLAIAVLIIAVFNYYGCGKGEPFRRRFVEMAGLSLSIAAFLVSAWDTFYVCCSESRSDPTDRWAAGGAHSPEGLPPA